MFHQAATTCAIPSPPPFFSQVSTPASAADDGVNNDSNAAQTASGMAVHGPSLPSVWGRNLQPLWMATMRMARPPWTLALPRRTRAIASAATNLTTRASSWQGRIRRHRNAGIASAVLGYTTGSTGFGTNVNALTWTGGTNGSSLSGLPVNRALVNVTTAGSKLSWVESSRSRHGKRYVLLQGSNARIDLRASGGANWSSALIPGSEYEVAVYADTASASAASIALTLSASSSIFQVISGPSPGYYSTYTVPQSEFTGPLPSFGAGD